MWYFSSPQVIFGEQALTHLERLEGHKAVIVSDATLDKIGLVERVRQALEPTGMAVSTFTEVEADPSLQTAQAGAAFLLAEQPDWIIALGGGSVMDAAKAMWIMYERPEVSPESINPIDTLHLRQKAHFVAIPTTTGTGSEATWAIVLTDKVERRKLGLGNREAVPDIAILDPEIVAQLPRRITVDTGLDALTHAVEGYTSTFHNDFCDGLCLHSAGMVFENLPKVLADPTDLDAWSHLQNAATIAGLGFGNSMAALAHGMGHSLGAVFHIPHGRAVALCLPYTIEYALGGEPGSTRYMGLAHALNLPAEDEQSAGRAVVTAIRQLEGSVGQPQTLAEAGVKRADFDAELEQLVQNAMNDSQTVMSSRVPEDADLRRLFTALFTGEWVDF